MFPWSHRWGNRAHGAADSPLLDSPRPFTQGGELPRTQMLDEEDRQRRTAHYRKMAQEAEQAAENAKSSETKEGFLRLAMEWRTLADNVERRA
jgi:hypothetical protein